MFAFSTDSTVFEPDAVLPLVGLYFRYVEALFVRLCSFAFFYISALVSLYV